jgi:hypothetical protein|nr:hypothetical protein [Kofleriaceae bacterium]
MSKTLVAVTTLVFVFAGGAVSHAIAKDVWLGCGLGACLGLVAGLLLGRKRVDNLVQRTVVTLNASAATCFSTAAVVAGASRLRMLGIDPHPSLWAIGMFLFAGLGCLLMACWLASRCGDERAPCIEADRAVGPIETALPHPGPKREPSRSPDHAPSVPRASPVPKPQGND